MVSTQPLNEVVMVEDGGDGPLLPHSHVFLGETHEQSERRTWIVIWLCGFMMIAEIAGGLLFGSIALVADGMHMSTHAGALLLAALAYRYARKHANDPGFTFGTGKFGDLAGFASAIILAMIALLIGYESLSRFFAPVPIQFAEAIPIACLGLVVNIASALILSGGSHGHGHSHGHSHGHGHVHGQVGHGHDDAHTITAGTRTVLLEVFEDNVPPRFRMRDTSGAALPRKTVSIETVRPDGGHQTFTMVERDGYLESAEEIPEPHVFTANVQIDGFDRSVVFDEHDHAHATVSRDYNMQAAVVHVVADAAVSVLVIAGLMLAFVFGWLWMDPLAGIAGACVIASWAFGLIRDTGAILLDMNPDREMEDRLRQAIESQGDRLADLHLWRLGPGHLGAIVSVVTKEDRDADYYRARLERFRSLSHLTVEVKVSPQRGAVETGRPEPDGTRAGHEGVADSRRDRFI
jgi:cation diffusion facilitator family transporter